MGMVMHAVTFGNVALGRWRQKGHRLEASLVTQQDESSINKYRAYVQ